MKDIPYVLRFLAGKTPGVEFPLTEFDREVVVGRAEEADLVLDDVMVSRRHARFFLDEHGVLCIEDAGSTNGIFVNAHRVQRSPLVEGDRIQIGTSLMKLTLPGNSVPGPLEATANWVPNAETATEVPAPAPSRKESGSRFGGSIDEIPMLDLVQLLSTGKKTGVLEVQGVQGFGNLHFRNGQLVYATVGRPVTVRRHKAVYRMLAWQSGDFEFRPPDEQTFADEVKDSTDALLLEAMRQIDEIGRIRKLLPPRSLRLVVAKPTPSPKGLDQAQIDVLKLIFDNPKINVGTILDTSPLPDLETYVALIQLARASFITVSDNW